MMFVSWKYAEEFSRLSGMHQRSIPAALIPSGQLRGIRPPCQSRGWGISNRAALESGICQPQGNLQGFDRHVASYSKSQHH